MEMTSWHATGSVISRSSSNCQCLPTSPRYVAPPGADSFVSRMSTTGFSCQSLRLSSIVRMSSVSRVNVWMAPEADELLTTKLSR
jgi:hypothetical protein